MPNTLKDGSELRQDTIEKLNRVGYDVENSPSTSALINPMLELLSELTNTVVRYYNRSVLLLATDEDLEEKASEFNITRETSDAPSDNSETNFHIDIVTGKARDYVLDINSPLVIPPNAISISDDDDNTYTISESVVIEPDSFSDYLPISANFTTDTDITANSISNIIVDYDMISNLDPTKVDNLEFTCNNNEAILSSSSISTDQEIKDAAYLRVNSMNNANTDAIRLQLKKMGINNVTFKKDMFGAGTLGLILTVANSSTLSDTAVASINNAIANVTPFARVVVPEVLKVKMKVQADYVDSSKIEQTKTDIKSEIQGYFDTLSMGKPMVPTTIENNVKNIDNVSDFFIRCLKIDDRPALVAIQRIVSDQIFEIDTNEEDSVLFTNEQ